MPGNPGKKESICITYGQKIRIEKYIAQGTLSAQIQF